MALAAAANPASGDYLYFVAGDDGTNVFCEDRVSSTMPTLRLIVTRRVANK